MDVNMNDKTGGHGLPENHVRLVRILPGCTEDLVLCETRVFSLPKVPGYTAISYAWGPPVAEHAIDLDGRRHLVPKNLWHFLTTWRRRSNRLRSKSEPRQDPFQIAGGPHSSKKHVETRGEVPYSAHHEQEHPFFAFHPGYTFAKIPLRKQCQSWLWIDALSIDQNSTQERDHQVKIMSRIFGGADEVVVWLGLVSTETDRGRVLPKVLTLSATTAYESSTELESLLDICDRVYWTRLWVFQELRSAKRIALMCGDNMVRFAKLASSLDDLTSVMYDDDEKSLADLASDTARREVESSRLAIHSAAARMVRLCDQKAPTSLWLLLQLTQHLDCYDPHDKIYALLSIAESGHGGIDADYTVPLPELMNRVLSNYYSTSQPPCASDVAIRCARLKAMMGLEAGFPWGADDYFAAERTAPLSTDPA
jgi:hypothetical protein